MHGRRLNPTKPRLLSQRHARLLHAAMALLVGSGLLWIVGHYTLARDGIPSPVESWALKLHGAAAMASLLAFGSLMTAHIGKGWKTGRNRASGVAMSALALVLIVTGYALYYFADEAVRPALSLVHWIGGLALLPFFLKHALGRMSAARARRSNAMRVQAGEIG